MHVRAHRSQSYIVVSKLQRQRGDPKVGSGSRPDSDDVNRAAHAVTPYPGYHFPGLPVVGPSATPRAPLLPHCWWGTRRSAGLAADAKPEQQFNRPSIAQPQTFPAQRPSEDQDCWLSQHSRTCNITAAEHRQNGFSTTVHCYVCVIALRHIQSTPLPRLAGQTNRTHAGFTSVTWRSASSRSHSSRPCAPSFPSMAT